MSATVSLTLSGVGRIYGPDFRGVLDLARAADDAGVDQIVVPDHVVMGSRTDRYPFGTFPYPPEEPWPEPLVTLRPPDDVDVVATQTRLYDAGFLVAALEAGRSADLFAAGGLQSQPHLPVVSRRRLQHRACPRLC